MMRRHFSSVIVGLITSIDNLGYGLALPRYCSLRPLPPVSDRGIGVILLSSAILPLVIGLRSGQPNAIALVQDTSIGIMASCIAAIAASMTDQPEHVRVATAFAILGTGSVATGALFWVSGRLRLGGLVRFLPYPVVAGFLAGSGWLLVYGAVSTLTGDSAWTEIAGSLAKIDGSRQGSASRSLCPDLNMGAPPLLSPDDDGFPAGRSRRSLLHRPLEIRN